MQRAKNFNDAWTKYKKGQTNKEIDSMEYRSLMEMKLKNEKKELWEIYNNIRNKMNEFWQNPDIRMDYIDKKDHSHANRICNYIDNLLIDETDQVNNEGIPKTIINLKDEDLFVLLCSIQLHDFGKGRWQLTKYSFICEIMEKLAISSEASRRQFLENTIENANCDFHEYKDLLENRNGILIPGHDQNELQLRHRNLRDILVGKYLVNK